MNWINIDDSPPIPGEAVMAKQMDGGTSYIRLCEYQNPHTGGDWIECRRAEWNSPAQMWVSDLSNFMTVRGITHYCRLEI